MLKRSLALLSLAAFACAITVSAVAQNNESNDQQSGPRHRHFDAAERTEMLTKQLKLNSDQQSKVSDILKSEQSQMEKLRSDSSVSQDDRHSKMMEMHKASNDQIRAVLDSDQQKKFDKMQSERGQWQEHHHQGQDSGAGPGSAQ